MQGGCWYGKCCALDTCFSARSAELPPTSAAAESCWHLAKKGSGFHSPAAEDTWLLETPIAAAGGNAKQVGVREDKDV